jgi:type III restriction enzyme
MAGFNFEKNLSHQANAVESTLAVFENLQLHHVLDVDKSFINPSFNKIEKIGNTFKNQIIPFSQYLKNIKAKQFENSIEQAPNAKSNIIDIMMETGTGKTYTLTPKLYLNSIKITAFSNLLLLCQHYQLKQVQLTF